ncbi:TetR/AcrR family transcriptional regulator [Actinocorallia libanotica]|uniref:TetR/AcrR family transcriptional regulator n=1 Tax=Actinocorallia libanotica TaxID=46162 RepID=A0ABP4BPC5_9ACTN
MAVQRSQRAGTARDRLLAAAAELFSRHGVSGTSLQMIADELGVTKAAVYHQFQSKEDIVWAVVTPVLDRLAEVAETAESRRSRAERVETLLSGLVDAAVSNRRLMSVLQSDPAVLQLLRLHSTLSPLEERITRLLVGPEPTDEALVCAAMVSGGLMATGIDPRLQPLDDDSLRRHLLDTSLRLLRVRRPSR